MLHMITCEYSKPFWKACINFCRDTLGETADMRDIVKAVVFNLDYKQRLLGVQTRAFLRHAVRWWYANMTAVHKENKVFIWQSCLRITLTKFKEAVIRMCTSIRRHYIHRRHTSLTGVVSEEERKKHETVAKINLHGEYTVSQALEAAISGATNAEATRLRRG